jgi:hypothetical protein
MTTECTSNLNIKGLQAAIFGAAGNEKALVEARAANPLGWRAGPKLSPALAGSHWERATAQKPRGPIESSSAIRLSSLGFQALRARTEPLIALRALLVFRFSCIFKGAKWWRSCLSATQIVSRVICSNGFADII